MAPIHMLGIMWAISIGGMVIFYIGNDPDVRSGIRGLWKVLTQITAVDNRPSAWGHDAIVRCQQEAELSRTLEQILADRAIASEINNTITNVINARRCSRKVKLDNSYGNLASSARDMENAYASFKVQKNRFTVANC